MGKSILLLLTAVILAGTTLALGQRQLAQSTNEDHREGAAQVFAREITDTGRHDVLGMSMLNGTFKPAGLMPALPDTFAHGGGEYVLLDYSTQYNDHVASFTIQGRFPYSIDSTGALVYTEHTVTSQYKWTAPNFPGPLVVRAPIVNADLDGSTIDGESTLQGAPVTGRSAYFDAQQHGAYNMNEIEGTQFDLVNVVDNFADSLALAVGGGASVPLETVGADSDDWDRGETDSMGDVLNEYNAPDMTSIANTAMQLLDDATTLPTANINVVNHLSPVDADIRFSTAQTLNPAVSPSALVGTGPNVGGWDGGGATLDAASMRLAHFEDDLVIGEGRVFSGVGLLLVEGNLLVDGELNWDGLVMVQSRRDTLVVEAGPNAAINVRGSLLIDHNRPPPGGHMDLTVWRDMTGAWTTPMGVRTNTSREYLRHMHRFGNVGGFWWNGAGSWRGCSGGRVCPSNSRPSGGDQAARQVIFSDGAGSNNSHEAQTTFEATLASLGSTPVFLAFGGQEAREDYNGASTIDITFKPTTSSTDITCEGVRPDDLGPDCRLNAAAAPYRTKPFPADELDHLQVNVGSLRLFQRMMNDQPIHYPAGVTPTCPSHDDIFTNGDGECISENHPATVSLFDHRQGALTLQLFNANTNQKVYEAAMYWHTKEPGHSSGEYESEVAADQAFYDALADGQSYGVRLHVGDALNLDFDLPRIGSIIERLGYDTPGIEHTGSTVLRDNEQVTTAF